VIERGERAAAAGAAGEVLGEIRCAQAIAAYWRSDYTAAVRFGDEALELLPVGAAAWFRAAGAAVVAAARLGDYAGVDRRFDRAVEAPCAPGAEAAQLQCLCRGTFQLVFNGRFARADEILARIAAIHDEARAIDALTTAQVEHVQGVRAAHVGDVGRFLRHLEAAVAAFERAGDVRNVSLERTTVAWCHAELGDLPRAERLCRDSLAHCQALRAPQATTYAKVNLGYILVYRPGARPEAVAVLSEAIDECRAVGNARLEGWARAHRATARLFDGDAPAALSDAKAAVSTLASAPGLQAWALALRARALIALGQAGDALADARAAIEVLDRLGGLLQGESAPPIALAEALAATGDAAGAAAAWVRARERLHARADRLGDPAWRASFLALPESVQILAAAAVADAAVAGAATSGNPA
jgi:tetratricopeptide (TPR) repeat protein